MWFSFAFSRFRAASHIGPLMRWHGFRPVIKLGKMELPGQSATVLFAADPCGKDWHVAQHNNLRANRGLSLPSLLQNQRPAIWAEATFNQIFLAPFSVRR
jgi:hypothetical protein